MDFSIEIQSEFDYVVRAFQFVAQMFNADSDYIGLIATLGIFGIFFGGVSAISAQAVSGRSALHTWFINMLTASVIVVILLSNKSTVIIHDTVSNQLRSVGGVPTVMAALAFMENRISQGVKDIMETVMQPIIAYDDIGRGEGFELLSSIDRGATAFFTKNPHILKSMESYFNKCVVPDLSQGWIPEKAIYGTADIWSDLKSQTMTRYSIVYSDGDPQGAVLQCANAWTLINNQLAVAQVKSVVSNQCSELYSDANAVAKCEANQSEIIDGIIKGPKFSSIDISSFLRSYLVSYAMHSANGSIDYMINEVNKKNSSSAFMAEKIIPRLKGMMYGMMIGIFPLLIGFLWFNPGKTVVFYAGMFLMIILWSAIDTFMDMQYQNEVYKMFQTMRELGLGVNQMFDIPNKAADAVSLYGSGRWMAMGLATAISAAITGVNAYAMSQMGSQLASSAQTAAAQGAAYMDSSGKTTLDKQVASDFGSRQLASMMSVPNWNAYGQSQAYQTAVTAKTQETLSAHYSPDAQVSASALAGATNTVSNNATAKGKVDGAGGLTGVENMDRNKSLTDAASTKEQQKVLSDHYGSLSDAGRKMGISNALSQIKNASATEGELFAVGGDTNKIANTFYNQGLYDTNYKLNWQQDTKAIHGSLENAAVTNAKTDVVNQAKNAASLSGAILASNGDIRKYLEKNEKVGFVTTAEAFGNTDVTNKMAAELGMSVEELAEFSKGANVLTDKNAQFLNNKYGTDIFQAGQAFNFKMNAVTGGLTEMSLADNVNNAAIGDYNFNGTASVLLDDNGSVIQTELNGNFNGYKGAITTDGEGNIINLSGEAGTALRQNLVDTKIVDLDSNYNVHESILKGDKRVFDTVQGLEGEVRDAALRKLSGSLAQELSQYITNYEQENWGTNVGGKVSAELNSNNAFLGKIVGAISGLKGGVFGDAGISWSDTAISQQNMDAKEIYDILQNNYGDSDKMLEATKDYFSERLGINHDKLSLIKDGITNAVSKVTNLGFNHTTVISKGPDGKIGYTSYNSDGSIKETNISQISQDNKQSATDKQDKDTQELWENYKQNDNKGTKK
ncbi:MAG: conjugal transfer protein TraG N-terminal domain-containing protein [Deferribacterales bacterium]|nr:conjugal transfer protein TraG N-terminal domain-containing protein [Deferribacterales bacterium]